MTPKDGNTAFVAPSLALILALSAALSWPARTEGREPYGQPGILAAAGGPALFGLGPGDPQDEVVLGADGRAVPFSEVARRLEWHPTAADHFRQMDAAVGLDLPYLSVSQGPPAGQPAGPEPVAAPEATPDSWDGVTLWQPGESLYRPKFALRFGWWIVGASGSPAKVGEYQDLDSSPFADADLLHSDGFRTIDVFATSMDDETSRLGLKAFGPRLQSSVDYQKFLHRLDHDPLTNMGILGSGEEIISEDLNAGEDYAIRVQDLKTTFRGKLTENIKVRLNFRMIRKEGDRQAAAVGHCAGGVPQDFDAVVQNHCHVLSRGQRIDWITMKIEPVIEAKYGPIRAEYSRPMRIFNQNDQVVRQPFGLHNPTDEPYALVPENFTQVDRLKLGVDLGAATQFYARMQTGNTENRFRQTHRKFYGFDLRLTNRSWDGVTLTGYATLNEQRNQNLPFLLPEEQNALAVPTSTIPPYGIRRPIDFFRRAVGADASWLPFRRGTTLGGLSFTTGAERGLIGRHHAVYVVQEPEQTPGPVYEQNQTGYTSFHLGARHRWSPSVETYARYRLRATEDPLFAVNRYYGYTNTNRPEEENGVELGGTLTLIDNLLATASVGFQDRQNHSEIADFSENNYPMTFTLWYAPTPEWSLSAGYGHYSNWIDQDITFPSDTPDVSIGDTRRWSYGGQGRVLSAGGSYAWTRQLTLSGGAQFVWTENAIDPLASWPDLSENFDVIVDRTRLTVGVDWCPRECISTYFRFLYEDYEDRSVDYNNGSVRMFLTGLSAIY